MVRVEVIKEFTLEEFYRVKNLQRKQYNQVGRLFVGDTFECDEEVAKYLTGNNQKGEIVVKVLEVDPKEEKSNKKSDHCKKNKNVL